MPAQDVNSNTNGGVQHYLIDSAREAFKSGDKSAAKSCLLTARYLSVNDSDVTYEIYQMAKFDGDVVEASKCFTNIFLDHSTLTSSKSLSKSKKLITEETRLMINELLHRHLKIKSVLNLPPGSIKGSSLSTSSMAGRRRSSSETPVIHDQILEEQFYLQLYETLSQDIQKAVLVQTIKNCETKLEQCRLLLLFLVLFPNESSAEDHEAKLLEELINMSEIPVRVQDTTTQNLMSIYYSRNLLISDAVPLILKNIQPDKVKSYRDDILLRIFSFYIEFCLSSTSIENQLDKMLGGQGSLTNNDKTTEKEHKVEVQFRSALHSMAKLMEWQLIDSTNGIDYTERWSQISNFTNKALIDSHDNSSENSQQCTKYRGRFKRMAASATNDDSTQQIDNIKQLFYSLVELMFLCITQYLRLTKNYILTETCVIDTLSELSVPADKPSMKKIKIETVEDAPTELPEELDDNFYKIDTNIVGPAEGQMKSSFLTAVRCYKRLTSVKKLNILWEPFADSLRLKEYYGWQRRFLVDYYIYLASYQQAIESIQVECKEINPYMATNDSEAIKLRSSIQLTICAFMLEEKTKTLDYCYNLMKDIKTFHILTMELDQSTSFHHTQDQTCKPIDETVRNFIYLSFSSMSFLSHCISIICHLLKQQTFSLAKPHDLGTGHLIVLSQYDWPRKCKLFSQCVSLIRKHKPKTATPHSISPTTKFTYHSFFNYVYNPCIIEEFMALLQQGYTLDIKSAGHIQTGLSEQSQSFSCSPTLSAQGASTSTKAITTRGVNKSFKEDMKSALVCQMKKSTVIPDAMLFINFILEEVIPYLKDRPNANQSKTNTKSSRRS